MTNILRYVHPKDAQFHFQEKINLVQRKRSAVEVHNQLIALFLAATERDAVGLEEPTVQLCALKGSLFSLAGNPNIIGEKQKYNCQLLL